MFAPLASLRGARASSQRLPPEVLAVRDFERRLKKERLRADRAHGMFALLAIKPPSGGEFQIAFRSLAHRVLARVRFSDEVGLLGDRRLGVILPDTSAAGAWTVAADIVAMSPDPSAHPTCDVYVYPFGPLWKGDDGALPEGSDRHERGVVRQESGNRAGATTAVEQSSSTFSGDFVGKVTPAERLLVAHTPWWKRAVDIAASISLILLFAPLLALVAATIKLTSRGPVFFRQARDGLGGRPFQMIKFRTMRRGADAEKQALRQHSEQDGPAFKLRNDPRVTSVGRFLRATSIDELPQLWNVLRGEMSLVGPRPLPCDESANCRSWQRRRLDVTPGLTCIWQVMGRSSVSFDDWMRMDLTYIRSRTLLHDLKLILMTIPAVLFRRGAH